MLFVLIIAIGDIWNNCFVFVYCTQSSYFTRLLCTILCKPAVTPLVGRASDFKLQIYILNKVVATLWELIYSGFGGQILFFEG